jgi:hypothetical protein
LSRLIFRFPCLREFRIPSGPDPDVTAPTRNIAVARLILSSATQTALHDAFASSAVRSALSDGRGDWGFFLIWALAPPVGLLKVDYRHPDVGALVASD